MNKLSQFLEAQDGKFSANRLVYIIGSLGILTIWAIKELRSVGAYELSESIVYIFIGLQASKTWQSYAERTKTTISVPTTITK